MSPKTASQTLTAIDDQEDSIVLGFKEILFLALILFFGFCGFSVCAEKIYAQQDEKEIKSIKIHDRDQPSLSLIENQDQIIGYSINY